MREHLAFLLLAVIFLGCGGDHKFDKVKGAIAEKNKTNIRKIANTCFLYASRNDTRSPKSKEDLIEFVQTNPKIEPLLEMMGIAPDSFEGCFISEVDGEELIVRYDARIDMNGRGSPIAFESKGVDGIRRVALTNGKVIEADDATYDRLMTGKTTKEEAGKGMSEMVKEDFE